MISEEISYGENKNIEFKREIPQKCEKYIKTIIAFANTTGGKLIFGVDDSTRTIVGIDEESVFNLMDSIANAVSDSCFPAIVPDISLQNVKGKTLIVVEVAQGMQKPYYIKSLGIEKGVYVRVGATSRPADEYVVKTLLFEGNGKSFDRAVCLGMEITDEQIEELCETLYDTAIKNCIYDYQKAEIKKVTKNTLISWGVLAEDNGVIRPTNAFALLTGNQVIPSVIQCGIFKGKTRSVFVDRREFSGPIQNQFEDAYRYVLAKINLGAEIDGLYRQDIYELPIMSIREVIANAVAHRNYLDPGNIQVALYDDRLEITSPGMLVTGVTIDKMKEGYSKVRNKAIASAFAYMKIIEKWGSGIPRIFDDFSDYGLKSPELIDSDGDFRVNLYRRSNVTNEKQNVTNEKQNVTNEKQNVTNKKQNVTNNSGNSLIAKKNERFNKIIELIQNDCTITTGKLALVLGVSERTIKRDINNLKKMNVVARAGNIKSGKWVVINRLNFIGQKT